MQLLNVTQYDSVRITEKVVLRTNTLSNIKFKFTSDKEEVGFMLAERSSQVVSLFCIKVTLGTIISNTTPVIGWERLFPNGI